MEKSWTAQESAPKENIIDLRRKLGLNFSEQIAQAMSTDKAYAAMRNATSDEPNSPGHLLHDLHEKELAATAAVYAQRHGLDVSALGSPGIGQVIDVIGKLYEAGVTMPMDEKAMTKHLRLVDDRVKKYRQGHDIGELNIG